MNTLIIPLDKFNEMFDYVEKIKEMVKQQQKNNGMKDEWYDNQDAMQILKISSRTLQTYRDTGLISFSQIGNKIYYKATDIQELLEKYYKPAFKDNKLVHYVK